MDMVIKVKTEVLQSASTDLKSKVANAKDTFDEIASIINRTAAYWDGKGHTSMAKKYSNCKDDADRIFDAIKKHAENLEIMANVYAVTEQSAISSTDMLSGDVIE